MSNDTTTKIEETEVGAKLTVESTRGTGTRDQDKIKAELRAETLAEVVEERPRVTATVKRALEDMRLFDDPATNGGDDE